MCQRFFLFVCLWVLSKIIVGPFCFDITLLDPKLHFLSFESLILREKRETVVILQRMIEKIEKYLFFEDETRRS
jgi:hypothetical protein